MLSLIDWRRVAAVLPLPMLALSAAYGVYSFQILFTPLWAALVSAAAFEATYIGLALMPVGEGTRRRATVISVSAVVVSVLYNVLAALFHIRPALLIERPLWADVALSIAHGLPLAVVAYAVADLLLHQNVQAAERTQEAPQPAPTAAYARVQDDAILAVSKATTASVLRCDVCGTEASTGQRGAAARHGRFNCKECGKVVTV